MEKLIFEIKNLKKGEISKTIAGRMTEFKKIGKDKNKIFSELCFCILTANSTAERCIAVQKAAEKHFVKVSEKKLAEKLKKSGARFHTKRAGYICEARKHLNSIQLKREWLVENVKGLGMKEASHFLRNIGFTDVAIIDFHVVDVLVKYKMVKRPKKLDKKTYLEIEEKIRELARKTKLNLAELDLYLWYMETKKILK